MIRNEDKALSPVLFTPNLPRIKTLNERLFYSNDSFTKSSLKKSSTKLKRNASYKNTLCTPYSNYGCFSQATPQSLLKRRSSKKSKSTLKKSLDALLDPDVFLSWTMDMATPPKETKIDADIDNFKEDAFVEQKKNVARVLFQVSKERTEECSGYLPLDTSADCLQTLNTSTNNNHTDNLILPSPTMFETSEVPSCGNTFELSPPITAKKKKGANARRIHHEHSLGVSLFESPQKNFSKIRKTDFEEQSLDVSNSPPIVSFVSRASNPNQYHSLVQPVKIKSNDNLFMEIPEFEDPSEKSNLCEQDDMLLSPPITMNGKNMSLSLKLPNDISQSTPIVSNKQPVNNSLIAFETYSSVLKLVKSPKKSATQSIKNNTSVDKDCIKEQASLLDELMGLNKNKADHAKKRSSKTNETLNTNGGSIDLINGVIDYIDDAEHDLSPSVTHIQTPIIEFENTSTNKKHQSLENTINVEPKAPDKSDSSIDVSLVPYQFNLDSIERYKNFLYPKLFCKSDKTECLDSISIMKDMATQPAIPLLVQSNISTDSKRNTILEDSLLPYLTEAEPNVNVKMSPKDSKNTNQSSLIDMDELSQLPFHLINTPPSKLKICPEDSLEKNDYIDNAVGKLLEVKDLNNNSHQFIKSSVGCDIHADISSSVLNHGVIKPNNLTAKEKSSGGFHGFQQSTNRIKAELSDEALRAAKHKFAKENLLAEEKPVISFGGFQTAKGTKVQISDKALRAAKEKFAEDNFVAEEKPLQGFSGFQTAKGTKVQISDEALGVAKQKFSEDNLVIEKKTVYVFGGFQTANGAKVHVSDEALRAAKHKFTEDNLVVEERPVKSFYGSQTAKGTKVQISDEPFKAAKLKFAKDNSNVVVEKPVKSFVGFQTANGTKVQVADRALRAAKQKFTEENLVAQEKPVKHFGGFQTANGTKVQVSDEALRAAKQNFAEDNLVAEEKPVKSFGGFQTAKGTKVQISDEALRAAKQKFTEENLVAEEKPVKSFGGFQTANGTKVQVSDEALRAAKQKFTEKNTVAKEKPVKSFGGFQTAKGTKVQISDEALRAAKQKFTEENLVAEEKPVKSFGGFQTANGTKVQVSDEALRAAKQKLNEKNTVAKEKPVKSFSGFQTANGTKVQVSDEALRAAKQKFTEENTVAKEKPVKSFGGFQTANGTEVQISDEALRAAKLKFADDNLVAEEKPVHSFGGFQAANGTKVQVSDEALRAANLNLTTDVDVSQLSSNLKKTPYLESKVHCKISTAKVKNQFNVQKTNIYPTGRVKRRIQYTSPETFQYDRNITFAKSSAPLSATLEEQKHIQCTARREAVIDKNKTPFTTPFKSMKRQSTNENVEAPLNSKKQKVLFSYKPLLVNNKNLGKEGQPKDTKKIPKMLFKQDYFLYHSKKSGKSLSEHVNFCCPEIYTKDELLNYGLNDTILNISGIDASAFQFAAETYFSLSGVKKREVLCCGFLLKINEHLKIGINEFKNALLESDDIDEKLVPEGWIENHYKWIVWKLASYERRYPEHFSGRCLTPYNVLEQLKYRYNKELEKAERSCLKKICERDDISTRRMILFVSQISCTSNEENLPTKCKRIIKLSDGWYEIKAGLDQPLSVFIDQGKIKVGTKLCIYGAELTGSTQGCSPLQAPESLMLMLSANSTRRATWDAKLGFQVDKKAFRVPVTSLYPDGGAVGCVCVMVLRQYPTQWMEKVEGRCVFRTLQGEEEAKRIYEETKRNKMETLYASVQRQFEENDNRGTKRKRRSLSFKEINALKYGKEIYNAIECAIDPTAVETSLTPSQKESVLEYKDRKTTLDQEKMMRKFHEEWQKVVEEEFPDRSVVELKRYRVCDCYGKNGKTRGVKDTVLTVWKPTQDIIEAFQEGARLELFNLNASQSRYKQTSCNFQLSTNNTTKYQRVEEDDENKASNAVSFVQRKVYHIDELYGQMSIPYHEVDVVGIVLHIHQNPKSSDQTMYITDVGNNCLAVKIWNGLQAFGIKRNFEENPIVALTNLAFPKFSTPTRNRILQVVFTDFSCFSKNPKATYLKEAVGKCRRTCDANFRHLANQSLLRLLQEDQKVSPLAQVPKTNIQQQKQSNTPLTSRSTNAVVTSSSEILPSEKLLFRQKLQMKKRLSLERFHKPPSLSPLQSVDKKILKSQFKPPSSVKK